MLQAASSWFDLKCTKQDSADSQNCPRGDKSHGQLNGSPGDDAKREQIANTEVPQKKVTGQLSDDRETCKLFICWQVYISQ